MATIKDIAKELELGVSTVSMALNGNNHISEVTRNRVLAKAKELNYVKNGLAVDLQSKKTNLILLVVDDASRPFFSRIINYVQKRVVKYGYNLLIATTFEGKTQTAKCYISERRADGIIVYTNRIDDEFLKFYSSSKFPIFVMGRAVEGENIYSDIFARSTMEGEQVIDYLVGMGHKKIAFVKSLSHTLGTIRRFEGYKIGLIKQNITIDESLIFDAVGSGYENGYDVTLKILPKIKEIDAIFYSNDDIAIAGVRCLLEHGIKVPEDVSIIGYNDLPSSELITPRLTSVSTDYNLSCNYAVDILVAAIKKEDVDLIKKDYVDKKETSCGYFREIIERDTVARK